MRKKNDFLLTAGAHGRQGCGKARHSIEFTKRGKNKRKNQKNLKNFAFSHPFWQKGGNQTFVGAGKSGIYINTYGKKGTLYYYKVKVMVYDKDGNLTAQTALKQCKYASRLWTK